MSKLTYLATATIYNRHTDDYVERLEYEGETRKEVNEWLCEQERDFSNDKNYRCKGRIHSLIECCGEYICCDEFTNTCDICGADYNSNGVRLAPRSQWGEETGESWEDCY